MHMGHLAFPCVVQNSKFDFRETVMPRRFNKTTRVYFSLTFVNQVEILHVSRLKSLLIEMVRIFASS